MGHAAVPAGDDGPVAIIGGRTATRRAGALRFDHGAQYVTARGQDFAAYLGRAAEAGHAGRWGGDAARPRLVGMPGMNDLGRPMAEGLDIRFATEIASARYEDGRWHLATADGSWAGTFAQVVSSAPAPQALRLFPDLAPTLGAVRMAPCWALMLAPHTPLGDLADATRLETGPLAFIARNASKPGRDPNPETWVVHASPEWSAEHLELDRDAACERLVALFADHAGQRPEILHAAAHRWRFAMTTEPLGAPFAAARGGSLLTGGDWALGARVEAAYDSGRAMAAEILGRQA